MNKYQFFTKLLSELSYRSKEGYPILESREHLSILSEILDEWGLGDIKNEFIGNLLEAEEKSDEDKKYKGIGGQPPAYVKAGEYKKWQSNPDGFTGEKFKKTDTGKYLPIDSGGDGEGGEESKPNIFSKESGYDAPDLNRKEDEDGSVKKGNGYVGSKNKTLRDVQPTQSEEYNRELEPSDDEFKERNTNNANPTPPEPISLEGIVSNPKFPKRYIKVLERMINSRYTNETKKWEHFSDISGGAGLSPAQAGELMTMVGSTMSDEEWNTFKTKILEHEKELKNNHKDVFMKKNKKGGYIDNPGSRIVDSTWVRAADNNRKIILARLKKQYGEGTEVAASAWDTKDEAEAMGMDNYTENKGFSTDMYLRVKKPNGEEVLDEISLKKSKDVNFLNSGAGQFFVWLEDDVPDEINQNVYRDNQRKHLVDTAGKLKSQIEQLLESDSPKAKELKAFFKRKGVDFETALEDTSNGKGSRSKSNVILKSIQALADWPKWGKSGGKGSESSGDPIAIQHLREVSARQTKFIEESISSLANNPKMKEGMLQTIREEFPLKAVSEGEETMAIGDMSLDKDTMNEIFGTSNYDEIKEKLVSEPGPPPFLGYRAEVGSDVIPIAEVSVREDGVGYGGQMKFEMKLDKRFASKLSEATSKVYSEE